MIVASGVLVLLVIVSLIVYCEDCCGMCLFAIILESPKTKGFDRPLMAFYAATAYVYSDFLSRLMNRTIGSKIANRPRNCW
jgi:hypothetical protein